MPGRFSVEGDGEQDRRCDGGFSGDSADEKLAQCMVHAGCERLPQLAGTDCREESRDVQFRFGQSASEWKYIAMDEVKKSGQ